MSVTQERRDEVLVITLDRPEKRNAMNEAMTVALDLALNTLEDDPALRVGILRSEGPVFCAGTDLREGAGAPTARGGPYGIIDRVRSKPLIASVEGPALGGGFEIVLCCDLVVASESASFGLPEGSRGMLPIYGGLARAPGRLPLNVVAELALTAVSLPATNPKLSGFVNASTPAGAAFDQALAIAQVIASNAPMPVREAVQILHVMTADEHQRWELTHQARERVAASADLVEAARSAREGRTPHWRDL